MSANIDVFSPPKTSTLKSELEKRVSALEQDVTEISMLLHELLQREHIKEIPGRRWEH